MPSVRAALRALLPFAAFAAARAVDQAVGTLLHTSLDLPGFVPQALRLLDGGDLAASLLRALLEGLSAWAALGLARARASGASLGAALEAESRGFGALYLAPALTLLALVSLAVRPSYPYGFTLPVALTQDWSLGVDIAMLAFVAVPRLDLLRRLPAPRPWETALLAFLVYALLTPDWARRFEGHPGNEPKTLRMAVALGHGLTLNTESVSAGMEELTPRPLLPAAADAAGTLGRESLRMLRDLARGPHAVGREAIRATRITRQTVGGKEGGVYHVLAPGPSFLLAPLLRVDRALNLRLQTPGRLAVTLLGWTALAALLVAALQVLLRDATGRPGLSAALAGLFALAPPYVFYAWQFYPEMLGALALAVLLRAILFQPRWSVARTWLLALLLAFLPWLHQKFLPVWGILALMAFVKVVDELGTLRELRALVVPQLASLYLFALYNYAITGSVRPDALFLAWGPGGVSSQRIGQGFLGLMLDARFGLLPYVPLYLLAGAGLLAGGVAARRLRLALPAALAYYLTVAAADNWSGAVCNLGRYAMPVTPVLAALVALALVPRGRAAAAGLALTLAGLSVVLSARLFADPHAANDSALLLARGTFADGNVYIPNLFIRTWAEGAPGLWARVLAWVGLAGALAWAARPQGPALRPGRVLAGAAALVLLLGFGLERWPSARNTARFPDAVEVAPGLTAFGGDGLTPAGERWVAGAGPLDLLVRSRDQQAGLEVTLHGAGLVRLPDGRRLPIPGAGLQAVLPLRTVATLTGRRGVGETLARTGLALETAAPVEVQLAVARP